MKMKKNKNKYWKGVPDELRYMCLANIRGSGEGYCTDSVIKYLVDHMLHCDSYIWGITASDIIRWIDIVIESCFFPLEVHEKDWKRNSEDIWRLLNKSEELLKRVAPPDYKDGCRTLADDAYSFNVIAYAQKLDVYLSVLFMFTEDWKRLEPRLAMLREDTERNVRNILTYYDNLDFATYDDWSDLHFPGMDKWEPINWLYRECLPSYTSGKYYVLAYEEYAIYLQELAESYEQSQAAGLFHTHAEERLRNECSFLIDEDVFSSKEVKLLKDIVKKSNLRVKEGER